MGAEKNPKGDLTPLGTGQTPQESPTLTQADIDRAVSKAKTDVGRLEAELRRSTSIAEAAIKRLKEREEAELRAEEEAAKDNQDELASIRKRREASRRIAEAEEKERTASQKEAELQTKREEIRQFYAERYSEKSGLPLATLLKYGGDTKDSMEEFVSNLGERATPSGEIQTPIPDSGKTRGVVKKLTLEDVAKMSPQERALHFKEIAELPLI